MEDFHGSTLLREYRVLHAGVKSKWRSLRRGVQDKIVRKVEFPLFFT
jgi:hypothetical protein